MFRKISAEKTLNVFGPLSTILGELREGDWAGVIATDQIAYSYVLYTSLSSSELSYYVDISSRFSPELINKEVFFAKAFSLSEILDATKEINDGSLLVIGSFQALKKEVEEILELKRITDEKGIHTLILVEEPLLNELNRLEESRRLLLIPEAFEQLFILRTSYYRGRYKFSLSVLRNYSDRLSTLGDHEVNVDEEIRRILSPGKGQEQEK
ncbi:hypothetical protein PFDSM3638_00250 [Pyrococcus furiosus DSM 3638]|uniref:KaiC-like domain-containing protein n=3 Tax=Pyrococcus furiosus TaxID=2261 RepID=Q8U4L6_PYRFU|nr:MULTISPECIES: hypothetical protein [Pyrococcus]AAL80189.1 hypothetical protein PF0065 [Pyrococcus furiosus DSM 3638]AFN04508.1 hypothetical protein PFC_07870 [Pyrococcus furiosus COM1]MDK2870434.1 hypothetical protein [Pyrococcus sp.]QEK77800.1 hypothetical protein PFDSM3638_00250 [Pyrococcus furiosus DSM 3638]